ncbi:hypothetical protein EHLJMEHL_04923 [Vreelandella titanicae]
MLIGALASTLVSGKQTRIPSGRGSLKLFFYTAMLRLQQKRRYLMFQLSQTLQRLAILLALLFSVSSMAQEATAEPDLAGQLLLTDQGAELFRARNSGTMHRLELKKLEVAPRDRLLTAIMVFSGCTANAAGNCDASVDYVLFDPEDKVYGELRGGELWQDKPAMAPGMYELSVEYMGIVIAPDDLAGQYRLQATINDRVSGSSNTFEWSFQVRE